MSNKYFTMHDDIPPIVWNGHADAAGVWAQSQDQTFIDISASADLADADLNDVVVDHIRVFADASFVDEPVSGRFKPFYIRIEGDDLIQFGIDHPSFTSVELRSASGQILDTLTPHAATDFGTNGQVVATSAVSEVVHIAATATAAGIAAVGILQGTDLQIFDAPFISQNANSIDVSTPGLSGVTPDEFWLYNAAGIPLRNDGSDLTIL